MSKGDCCDNGNAGGWGSYSGECERCPDPSERLTLETRLDEPNGMTIVYIRS